MGKDEYCIHILWNTMQSLKRNGILLFATSSIDGTSLVAQMVKASAYNAGDMGLIPGLGRSLGEGTHSSTLAWKIPWMEEPSRLQSTGLQRIGHD